MKNKVVFFGEADYGKTTLIGHGGVRPRELFSRRPSVFMRLREFRNQLINQQI